MSTHHLIEAIAEEERVPACPHCGSDNLQVVYTATVTQPALDWDRKAEGVWTAVMYESAEINFDSGIREARLECCSCSLVAGYSTCDADTFRLIDPESDAGKVCVHCGAQDGAHFRDCQEA